MYQFLDLSSSDYNNILWITPTNAKNHELKNIFNGIQHLILIPMQKLFSNPIFDFRNNLQTIHSKIGCSRLLGIKVEDIICVPGAS